MSLSALFSGEQPVKWLFYGDSITQGAYHTFGGRDYSQLFAERVRFEMDRRTDVVINTAISGNTAGQLLDGFEWRVRQFSPHVVFVMIGVNDCRRPERNSDTFAASLQRLNDQISQMNAVPVWQTTNMVMTNGDAAFEAEFELYMQHVRDVATRNNRLLVDHLRYWKETSTDRPSRFKEWLGDDLHPNAYGHQLLAEHLYQRLDIYDPTKESARLFRP